MAVSEWVAQSDWGYPLLLSAHSMGMVIVVGILLMLDLRALGYAKGIPLEAFERLMPFAWGGFLINLVTGTLLFGSAATKFPSNWPFICKMAAIVIAGLISWAMWRQMRSSDALPGSGEPLERPAGALRVTRPVKVLAAASIAVWLSAIFFGRLIAYVMDAALLQAGT